MLSEKQTSSIVMAVNLSFKSFSRLYLAERFSLKEEGKAGKNVVKPAGSWETLETKLKLDRLSMRPSSMSPVHTRARPSLS